MNMLDNVLSRLPKAKTSADFAEAITDLETENASALAAVGDLEGQREDLIFSGGDLDRLEADIAAAGGKVKTLDIALTGARRRHTEATEAERQAELEATGKAARKINARLESALKVFSENAEALAKSACQPGAPPRRVNPRCC